MGNIDRRTWLKGLGMAGIATLTTGVNTLQAEELVKIPKTGPIRLSSNENPFGPSQKVRKAMTEAFDEACRYPGMFLRELRDKIAAKEGVSGDHIVICGGSTEGLKITGAAYGLYGGEIIAPRPTFLSMMEHASLFGATVNWVDVDKELQVDLDEMEKRISAQTRLIFLCNPNNPTSGLIPAQRLKSFCESVSKRVTVFSDEAYYDFIDEPNYPSMVELVKKGHNVIVSRTFSKVYGLAGLRIGYLVARPDIAERLREHVVAFTNVLAIKAASVALDDKEFWQYSIEQNRKSKKMIYETVDKLGLRRIESHTNFVFFETGKPIEQLISSFRSQNIEIGRPFPPFDKWCRISTGTIEDTDQFCSLLRKFI